jgi:hypothetical protein
LWRQLFTIGCVVVNGVVAVDCVVVTGSVVVGAVIVDCAVATKDPRALR